MDLTRSRRPMNIFGNTPPIVLQFIIHSEYSDIFVEVRIYCIVLYCS